MLKRSMSDQMFQVAQEHLRKKKRRKISSIPNCMFPVPPFQPTDLASLLKLGKMCMRGKMFRDCQMLCAIMPVLQDLDDMVGIADVKQSIVDYVLLRLQRHSLGSSVVEQAGNVAPESPAPSS